MKSVNTSRLPVHRGFWLAGLTTAMLLGSTFAVAGEHDNASQKHDKAAGHEAKGADHAGKPEKHDKADSHDADGKDHAGKSDKHDKADSHDAEGKDHAGDKKHDKADGHSGKGSHGGNIFQELQKAAKAQDNSKNIQ